MQLSSLDLTALDWVLLALGAAMVGFAKTAIGSVGALAVVASALALPAKESTGALLPLLIVGDLIAVRLYHRHAEWRLLLRLLPGVLAGLLVGAWCLARTSDEGVRTSIGIIILAMTGLQFLMGRPADGRKTGEIPPPLVRAVPARRAGPIAIAMGVVAGFATMTANAAAPVTTLYLLRAGLPKWRLIGTASWLYLVVNLAKLPLSTSLGLVSLQSLVLDATLLPPLGLGAVLGARLITRLDQELFQALSLTLGAMAAVVLLLS